MKYILGSVTIEAIDTYVRVTVCDKVRVTNKECPKSTDIAHLLYEMQGYYPNNAQLFKCGSAADDARRNNADKHLFLD